ncbi:MAG: hypothetical protein Q7S80_02235 [bacterium]|nr:hypothetical protein [bacterium]
MDLNYLHQSSYWLSYNADLKGGFFTAYLIIFSLLFIAGLAITMLTRGDFRKIAIKYATPLILTGILGWIYLLAQREQLPWLSTRLVLLLIVAKFLLWIFILLFWSARHVPKMIKTKKLEEKFNKYLPKTGNR